MAKRVGVDKILFCTTLVLVVIGLVMVFSASAIMADAQYHSPYFFVVRQGIWAVLGLAAMTVLMQVDYRKLNRPTIVFPIVAVTAVMLLGVFVMPASTAPIDGSSWARFLCSRQNSRNRRWYSSWHGSCKTSCK